MNHNPNEVDGWNTSSLNSIKEVFDVLEFLKEDRWLNRGQSKCWGNLIPKFDRDPLDKINDRGKKLDLELETIHLFQSIASSVASNDEREELKHDMNTLSVLQHYGVPTRLLDWSLSPYVATFFAIIDDENEDGEIWVFKYDRYIEQGNEQWKKYPKIPLDAPIEVRYSMIFGRKKPNPDFFMCVFDYLSHHRLNAQCGLFSLTARYGIDHAKAISSLFNNDSNYYHRYIIKSDLKRELQKILHDNHDIWLGSLFPDTAGAAEAVKTNLFRIVEMLPHKFLKTN